MPLLFFSGSLSAACIIVDYSTDTSYALCSLSSPATSLIAIPSGSSAPVSFYNLSTCAFISANFADSPSDAASDAVVAGGSTAGYF